MDIDIDTWITDTERGIKLLSPLILHKVKELNPNGDDYVNWLRINNIYYYTRSPSSFNKEEAVATAIKVGADYLILNIHGGSDAVAV